MRREELERLVKELKEQDKELQIIFERRKEIAQKAKENRLYNELWDMLFTDGKPHIEF